MMQDILFSSNDVEKFYSLLKNHKQNQKDIYVNPSTELTMNDNGRLVIDNRTEMVPTNYFEQMLAQKLGIPYDYYIKMPEYLRAINVNHWLKQDNTTKLIRALQTPDSIYARAYLSDRYMIIDNYDVMTAVLMALKTLNKPVVFHRAFVSEKMMNVNILDNSKRYNIGKDRDDYVSFGINIQNSEVGYSAFTMNMFIYRYVCSNGMVTGVNNIRRVHIGSKYTGPTDWVSDNTRRLESKLLLSTITDMVNYIFNDDNKQIIVEKMIDAREQRIEQSTGILNAMKKVMGLTEEEASSAWSILREPSRFEITQAITQMAQKYETNVDENTRINAEKRLRLEEKAGKLMFDDEVWNKFIKTSSGSD